MADTILICDDEELIRWSLGEYLQQEGYTTVEASNGKECIEKVHAHAPTLVLMDLKMPVMDGLTALRLLREQDNDLPVIMITAHGGVDSAIEATRLGAADYIAKPFDLREVGLVVRRAIAAWQLKREVHYLRDKERGGYGQIVGNAPAMQRVFDTLRRLESIDAPTVLIQGESGTGKDIVARSLHARGPRKNGPFMEVDCTALPEQLMESELFGHERGSFTDARSTKRGLFEVAKGGVVFLDEIGELPFGMQSKLLRVLENRRFRRVGGVADIAMDTAVITATNRNLRDEVRAGRFREDLFFRLHVVPLEVPALRERRDDIPLLANHFIERLNKSFGKQIKGISGKAMELLMRYRWPGNVRELRNIIERTVIMMQGDVILPDDLPAELRFSDQPLPSAAGCPFVLPEEGIDLEAVEKGMLIQALQRTTGNQSAAARLLGITRYALRYRMEKFSLATN